MTLMTVATGSSGNCYVLKDSKGKILILDVGIQAGKIFSAIDFQINDIEGVCISHEHKDHSLSKKRFATLGIPIADTEGTYHFGDYFVKTFSLLHDVPCIGFYIYHPELGSMVYLTDTEYCKYRFPNINHILCECNYDKSLIDHEHPAKEHILTGHMELQTVEEFIWANKSENLKTVCLCHMSRMNLDFQKALETIKQIFSNTYMVEAGQEIEL